MYSPNDLAALRGADAVTESGEKIGSVSDVYLDDTSGQPSWATIHTGLLGLKPRLVPLDAARFDGRALVLPFSRDAVRHAPDTIVDNQLTAQDESALRAHYYHEGRDPQVPVQQNADSRDRAEQVGDVIRTDRPVGDFVDETDLDTLHDDAGRIAPVAATGHDGVPIDHAQQTVQLDSAPVRRGGAVAEPRVTPAAEGAMQGRLDDTQHTIDDAKDVAERADPLGDGSYAGDASKAYLPDEKDLQRADGTNLELDHPVEDPTYPRVANPRDDR